MSMIYLFGTVKRTPKLGEWLGDIGHNLSRTRTLEALGVAVFYVRHPKGVLWLCFGASALNSTRNPPEHKLDTLPITCSIGSFFSGSIHLTLLSLQRRRKKTKKRTLTAPASLFKCKKMHTNDIYGSHLRNLSSSRTMKS